MLFKQFPYAYKYYFYGTRIFKQLTHCFVDTKEESEIKVKKGMFVLSGIVNALCAFVWSVFYLVTFHNVLAATMAIGSGSSAMLALIMTKVTKRFEIYATVQTFLWLIVPALVNVSLGGFYASGGVLVWSLFAPLSAFFLQMPKRYEIAGLFLLVCLFSFCYDVCKIPSAGMSYCFELLYMNFLSANALLLLVIMYNSERLMAEKKRGDDLLEDIFPHSIVCRLKKGENHIADNVDDATILFCDIVGFSAMATTMSASQVANILNRIFSGFDCLTATRGVEKIKTIGDAYMVGANISIPNKNHPEACVDMAISMIKVTEQVSKELGRDISVRIGVASGPLVACVIGLRHKIFDVYGSTVNMASRMESTGVPGCVQISEETANRLSPKYTLKERGFISVKGLGLQKTYLMQPR